MITAFYQHFRSNHPISYKLGIAFIVTCVSLGMMSFAANNTEVFDLVGAKDLKKKVVAAKETAYWHFRAWKNNDKAGDITPQKSYGYMQSVNRDGSVNIVTIADGVYKKQRITLADTIITNPAGLAEIVQRLKRQDAEFDLYDTPQNHSYTVVWINNHPFNLQIIADGVARPDITPPTNIVDQLFADYYWAKLVE